MTEPRDEIEVTTVAGISRALELVRARIASVLRDRSELDKALTAAREEEQLLQRLLALRQGEGVGANPTRDGSGVLDPVVDISDENGSPMLSAVMQELALAGRPVHISDLMRLLSQRQIPIPGAGTQANLITYLRRDGRIVRTSRGMYALASWGLGNTATKPLRRRGRRMRATAQPRNNT